VNHPIVALMYSVIRGQSRFQLRPIPVVPLRQGRYGIFGDSKSIPRDDRMSCRNWVVAQRYGAAVDQLEGNETSRRCWKNCSRDLELPALVVFDGCGDGLHEQHLEKTYASSI
jgi:hypothetical protein